MIRAMRTVLLLAMTLGLTGCWKTIHEASGPPALERRPAVAAGPATANRRV